MGDSKTTPRLPKPSAFKYSNLAATSTAKFEDALTQLNTKYKQVLAEQLEQVTARQNSITANLKNTETLASRVVNKTIKSNRVDYSSLPETLASLEEGVRKAQSHIAELLDDLYEIDCALPASDRLLAPHHPNRHHYKLLHPLMVEQSCVNPRQIALVGSEPELFSQDIQVEVAADTSMSSIDLRAKLRASLAHH